MGHNFNINRCQDFKTFEVFSKNFFSSTIFFSHLTDKKLFYYLMTPKNPPHPHRYKPTLIVLFIARATNSDVTAFASFDFHSTAIPLLLPLPVLVWRCVGILRMWFIFSHSWQCFFPLLYERTIFRVILENNWLVV